MIVGALAVIGLALVQEQTPTAASLISKMFALYSSASTLTGTIKWVQSAEGRSLTVDSVIQYERPNKIFLRQTGGNPRRTWTLSCDGKLFSYDPPRTAVSPKPGERLVEPVAVPGKTFQLGEIYAAASESLGDTGAPLNIAIAFGDHLKFLKDQWVTFQVVETKEVDGKKVYAIQGRWREYAGVPDSADFYLEVSESGDLKRYDERHPFKIASGGTAAETTIINNWYVNLTVNGKVDPTLFKLIR